MRSFYSPGDDYNNMEMAGIRRLLFNSITLCLVAAAAHAQTSSTESSAADFDAGTYNATYRSGSDSAPLIGLDYQGRTAGLQPPEASAWFDGSWKYRKRITVTAGAALADYRVPVILDTQALIAAGRLRSDGADLRFTAAADSATSLPYAIEQGWNTASTRIWVKVPSLPSGATTLYMYYGNTGAAAASSMGATFLFGDEFGQSDGSSPSGSWTGIQSAVPASGSLREVRNGRLRIAFGAGGTGTRYYGLRTGSQYSYAAGGRRYHVTLEAKAAGTGLTSMVTLCPTLYSFSEHETDWLRFSIVQAADGPKYAIDKKDAGLKSSLVAQSAIAAGFHDVDFLITGSTVKVLIDGAEVYSAANALTFNAPYIYLEAASSQNALNDFLFDNVFATPYAAPDPAVAADGAEQGRYLSTGYYVSRIRDTGALNTRYNAVDWQALTSTSAALSVEVRAHNTDVSLSPFVAVTKGGNPGVAGRYVQYRVTFTNTDVCATPQLSSMTLTYTSPPLAPQNLFAETLSTTSLRWSWQYTAADQYQTEGFYLFDQSNAQKASLGAGANSWTENDLTPNTRYTRYVQSYNIAGSSSAAAVSKYTLPRQPDVAADRAAGSWCTGITTFTFTNAAGFGTNGLAYYRYAWDSLPIRPTWDESEQTWNAGTLTQHPGASGVYYLHAKSFNGEDVENGTKDYGPFRIDADVPQAGSFQPSSSSWLNDGVSVQVPLSDAGGSKLAQVHYRWTNSAERPYSGWSTWDTTIVGSDTAAVTLSATAAGQWYLHVEFEDGAGNRGYAYAGPYLIDRTAPTGTLSINGGKLYTYTRDVTLSLASSDDASGVQDFRLRNDTGTWSEWQSFTSTVTWSLSEGDGLKTVECELRDRSGNAAVISDAITLDSRTTLSADFLTTVASGEAGNEAKHFPARATLTYDKLPGVYVGGRTVTFNFQGSPQSVLTDAYGLAVATYTVPSSSGTYTWTARFDGDGTFSASEATGTVTAQQRPSEMTANDLTTTTDASFTATARLKDSETASPVKNRTVYFDFNGNAQTAVTNDVGIATVSYSAALSTSVYTYTARYDGDATYGPSNASGKVAIGMKLTGLSAFNVSTVARSTFTVQASLKEGTNPVVGRTISFVFNGSTRTAVTGGDGSASVDFAAPNSLGTYVYVARFDGDSTFAASNASANVTVLARTTNLVAAPGSVGYALDSFTTWAQLFDGATGSPVSGKSVSFFFEGSTQTAVTDGSGRATTSFPAGSLARGSTCYYQFPGDSDYGASADSAPVTINLRPTALFATEIGDVALSTITAKAELKDSGTNAGIAGKTVLFLYKGLSRIAVTNAVGVATVTYTTGMSTGAASFSATFDADGTYTGASSTATVTISLRPSVLSVLTRWGYALDAISATADLKDGITGAPIPGKTVSFTYSGATQSTTTSSDLGRASVVYPGTATAGAYLYSGSFAGDTVYLPSSGTASISVYRRPTNVTAAPIAVDGGNDFTVSAELRDGFGLTVSSKVITFVYQGVTKTVTTNAVGVATATYSASTSTGTFSYSASFAQDATYEASSDTKTVSINRRVATINANPVNVPTLNSVFVSATLFDGTTPMAGMPVRFVFKGATITATTDPTGLASAGPFASLTSSGAVAYSASFDGNANYLTATSSAAVTAEPRATSVSCSNIDAVAGSTFTITAGLQDALLGGTGVAGKTLQFVFNGSTRTAVTNGSGIAVSSFTAPSSTGTLAYTVRFPADGTYEASANTMNVALKVRPTVLQVQNYWPVAGSTFTVTAALKDTTGNAFLANQNVSFCFNNSTRTIRTDALGQASTTYIAPASTGTYSYTATYAGDGYYDATNANASIYVGYHTTALQAIDASCIAVSTFNAKAILKDTSFGNAPVAGKQVTFTFNGSSVTCVTGADGVALSTFTAPSSTGTYTFSAVFAGDSYFTAPAPANAVVTVLRRPVVVNPQDMTLIPALSTFTVTAELTDAYSGLAIGTKTVTFAFQAQNKAAVTDIFGTSTATFTAPASTGSYTYTATFAGDALYENGSGSAGVTIIPRTTVVAIQDVAGAPVGMPFTGTAVLKDYLTDTVIAAKPMRFLFQSQTGPATTNGVGVATATFTAPSSTGTYSYSAVFDGDSLYYASQSTGSVSVGLRATNLALASVTTTLLSTYTVRATLTDYLGNTLAAKPVTFTIEGATRTAVTDAAGVAIASFTATNGEGDHTYACSFAGDTTYGPVTAQSIVTMNRRQVLFIPGESTYFEWQWTKATTVPRARLIDAETTIPIAAKSISFYFQGSTRTATTDSGGWVSTNFPAISTAGWNACSATFDGDATYKPYTLSVAQGVYISARTTSCTGFDVTVAANSTFNAKAKVVDADPGNGSIIPNAPVKFTFNGSTMTCLTDDTGVAVATFTAPGTPQNLTYRAEFFYDQTYNSSYSTSSVKVGLRPSLLVGMPDNISVGIGGGFQTKAKLTDSISGNPLAGKTVTFAFRGSSQTATTDGSGLAWVTYTAPLTISSYTFNAAFAGDALYDAYIATGTVTVTRSSTTVTGASLSVIAGESFAAGATLLTKDGAPIAGRTLTLVFESTASITRTAISDSVGVASATFTAPLSTGPYNYQAFFDGDALYFPSSDTVNAVSVKRRPTAIAAQNLTAYINDNFTASAFLSDQLSAAALGAKSVHFVFHGGADTTADGTTDSGYSLGTATAAFAVPASTGSYTYSATFGGDGLYDIRSDTKTVTVVRRLTSLTGTDVTAQAGTSFVARATLSDVTPTLASTATLAGQPVTFVFGSSTTVALTDAYGIAVATFDAPSAQGNYNYTAAFAGDGVYAPASDNSNTVTISKRATMLVADPVNTGIGMDFTAKVMLLDNASGGKLASQQVTFTFNGTTITVTTDELGNASAVFTAPLSVSTYSYTVAFPGDPTYAATATSALVSVLMSSSVVTGQDVAAVAGNTFQAVATLTTPGGSRISGRLLTFVFESTSTLTQTAVTNASGVANTTFTAPLSTGTYNYKVLFDGDSQYFASSDTVNAVTVARRATTMATTGATVYASDPFNASALLRDQATSAGVGGRDVRFIFHSLSDEIADKVTNAAGANIGASSATFTAPASSGTYSFSASFAGDPLYEASASTSNVTVNRRITSIAGDDAEVYVNMPFTAKATLRDVTPTLSSSVTLSGLPVTFVFGSSTTVAYTDAVGIATATFTSSWTAGSYTYQVSFAGNPTFEPSSDPTNTVVVKKRPSVLVADQSTTPIGTVFPARATLVDGLTSDRLGSRALRFNFQSSSRTATTDDQGVAQADFTAPMTVSSYTFTTFFDGDASYEAGSTTGTVVVTRSSCTILGQDVTVIAGNTFTAQASFSMPTGVRISGKTLTFVFESTSTITKTAVTDALGVASISFTAPLSTGSFNYQVTFPGDSQFYASSDTVNAVTVNRRPTTMAPQSATVFVNDAFTASSVLRDLGTSAGIGAKNLHFIFHGAIDAGSDAFTASAGSVGTATTTFTAPASSGTYSFSSTFEGDPLYEASSGTGTVTVNRRITALAGADVDVFANMPFQAKATLSDITPTLSSSATVAGLTVRFVFGSSTTYAVTDAFGVATATYTASWTAGSYNYQAFFDGDPVYANSQDLTNMVTVKKRTTVVVPDPAETPIGASFQVTGTLMDTVANAPLGSKQLKFVFQGSTVTTTTDGLGIGIAGFTAPLTVSTYPYTVSFAGDTAYEACLGTGTVTATKSSCTVTGTDVTAVAGNSFQVSATLAMPSGAKIAGKSLSFVLQSTSPVSLTGTTNASGVATVNFTAPWSTGTINYTVSFAGDVQFYPADDLANTVTVLRRASTLSPQSATVYVADRFDAAAILRDQATAAGLGGRDIRFVFHPGADVIADGVTNSYGSIGTATATFTAPASSGTVNFSATFTGDALYDASSGTNTVTVNRRLTSISGDDIDVYANDPFTAKATLSDVTPTLASTATIAGKTVMFVFGSSTAYVTTNSVGVATFTFTAPSGFGTYNYTVSFAGDGAYMPASDPTNTVTVRKRATSIIGQQVLTTVGENFNAQATLVDSVTSAKLSGKTVNFTFTSATATFTRSATTDAQGYAAAAFTAPLSTGTFYYTAAFPGDTTFAASVSSSISVAVGIGASKLTARDGTSLVNAVFVATATLTSSTVGTGIPGRQVRFTFQGVTNYGVTNTYGVATATFAATGLAAGPYRLDANFDGDASYDLMSASATITVTRRPASLTSPNLSVYALDLFTSTATFKDGVTNAVVAGENITFTFTAVDKTMATNALGLSSATYAAPASSGTYSLVLNFPGDAVYNPASASVTIAVGGRNTWTTLPAVSAVAGNVFASTATLRDVATGAAVAGRQVRFVFNGSTSTVTTDGSGVAISTATAPLAAGSYRLDATFPGDATYNLSLATTTVTVAKRATSMRADDIQGTVMNLLTATATLTDNGTGTGISGTTVTFTLNGTQNIATTNASGIATTSFTAPVSSGSYRLDVAFNGNATYNLSSSSAAVTLARRSSLVTVQNASGLVGTIVTSTATLQYADTLANVAGRTLRFVFQGSTATAVTDANGIARSTFTVPGAAGPYGINVYFDGDASYAPNNAAGTITALRRDVAVAAVNVQTTIGTNFVSTATLTDVYSGQKVSARNLRFVFDGSTVTAPTNGSGSATATFTTPSSSGTYRLDIYFDGDTYYNTGASSTTVTVQRRPTALAAVNASVPATEVFTASGTLTDSMSGTPVAGKTVTFTFNSTPLTATTNGVGLATATYTAPAAAGGYRLDASFSGDGTYLLSTTSATVTVTKRVTAVAARDVTVTGLEVFKATATLTDVLGAAPVSGKTVRFNFYGSTQTAVTDGTGIAAVSFTAPGSSGTYRIDAFFDGDATYALSSASATATVMRRYLNVAAADNTVPAMSVFKATATVADVLTSAPLSGKSLRFVFNGSTVTAVTNGVGVATATYTAPPLNGTLPLNVYFDGDAGYYTDAASGTVTVQKRITAIGGMDTSGVAMDVFRATATLVDVTGGGAGLSGQTVSFVFNGSTVTATTTSQGAAIAAFTAPASTGAFRLDYRFDGSGTYNLSSGSMTVTVLRRGPAFTLPAASVIAGEVLTATATLRDAANASAIAAQPVTFSFAGSTFAAVTNGSGVAVSTFTAPLTTGLYRCDVTFDGNALYTSTAAFANMTVLGRDTTLAAPAAAATAQEVFRATATLTDVRTGSGVSGRTVQFTVNGIPYTGTTDTSGVATADCTAPQNAGAYRMDISFAGDTTYNAKSSSATLTVLRRTVAVTGLENTATALQVFTASATLTDTLSSAMLTGKSLRFVFNGSTVTASTNGAGLATANFIAPASSGTVPLNIYFDADTTYAAASGTSTITVQRRNTAIGGKDTSSIAQEVFKTTATLTDVLSGTAVNGRTVSFVFNGSTSTATTDASGNAYGTFSAPSSTGAYRLDYRFDGDATYGVSSGSATVVILRRYAAFTAPNPSVVAGEIVTATATLKDAGNAAAITGQNVSFVFTGTTVTAATNGAGVSTAAFTAPLTTGTYRCDISFGGSALYNSTGTFSTVTVLGRNTLISVLPSTATAMAVFRATATLTDAATLAGVNGRTVSFTINGNTFTGTTNASGIATADCTAPSTAGDYRLDVAFAGDATYNAKSSSTTISIARRAVVVNGLDAAPTASEVFTASATIRDAAGGTNLSGKTLRFTFNGSTLAGVTDTSGRAAVNFTAPSSSGTLPLTIAFDADATYAAGSGSGTITVMRRGIYLRSKDTSAVALQVFKATATVTDVLSGNPVNGRTVRFVFNGSTQTATSNALGDAVATFTAPSSTGPWRVDYAFDGDATYNVGAGSATVTVLRRFAVLSAPNAGVIAGEVVTATATLRDAWSAAFIGTETVRFVFNGSTQTASTNGAGVATSAFTAPGFTGAYRMDLAFDGNALYNAAASSMTVTVAGRDTLISVLPASSTAMEVFKATATLTDAKTFSGVGGRTVSFTINGTTFSGVTDSSGVATASCTAPQNAGDYRLDVSFAGDTTYNTKSSSTTVTVIRRNIVLAGLDSVSIAQEVFTASATLRDAISGTVLNAKPVRFVFKGVTGNGTTNASGLAHANFTAPTSTGTHQMDIYFDADATYASVSATSTVTALRRPSVLAALPASGTAQEVFTATATLRDALNGQALPGCDIQFVFNESTHTATTNSTGLAATNFTAPASSGAYPCSTGFAGNALYEPFASTATVTVLTRPTRLASPNVTVLAADVFTATATLSDVLGGGAVAGRQVRFVFNGSTVTAATDGAGAAAATLTAPSSTGTVRMDIYFDGDNLYRATSSSAGVTSIRRYVTLTTAPDTVYAGELLVATATLVETASLAPVRNRALTITFSTGTLIAATNGVGVATAPFTAPSAAGPWALNAAYAGDASYYAASSSATITVLRRVTALPVNDVASTALEVFTATATLVDVRAGLPMTGKTVTFTFNAGSLQAVTNSVGVATVTFTSPSTAASYPLVAVFNTDPTYAGVTSSATVSVAKRAITVTVQGTTGVAGEAFTAAARLTDTATAAPQENKTLRFVFQGVPQTATTDANGQAAVSFTCPVTSGTYRFDAFYDGDPTYAENGGFATVSVTTRETRLRSNDGTANSGEPFVLTTVLTDVISGNSVPNKQVRFTFNGVPSLAVTNEIGVATVTYVAPAEPGVYYYDVNFMGDYTYSASSTTAKIKTGILTTLMASDLETYAKNDFTARAKLTDVYSIGLEGKPVRFAFQGSSATATTDAGGFGEHHYTAPVSSGTYLYNAWFDGDNIYSASQATATVTVKLRPTVIMAQDAAVLANSSFTVTVELQDVLAGAGIAGMPVDVTFNGVTVSTATGPDGRVLPQFFAAVSSGTYNYYARFGGDATYSANNATATISIQLRSTTLISQDVTSIVNSSFTARVELKDNATNTGVAGKPVLINCAGVQRSVVTTAAGIAETSFAAPASSSAYTFSATFDGDGQYMASNSTATVTINPRPTFLLASNMSMRPGGILTTDVRLIDITSQAGISGKPVTVNFQGSVQTVTTDASGAAAAVYAVPSSTGIYPYSAAFNGDAAYAQASSTANVIIGLDPTVIVADGDTEVRILDRFNVRATLSNASSVRLAGKPVIFTFGASSATASTNDLGIATASFATTGLVSTGTYTFAARFDGDPVYTGSSDNLRSVNVTLRTPGLAAHNVNTVPTRVFTVQTTLTDNVGASPLYGQPVANAAVRLEFNDGVSTVTAAALTDAYGVAAATFTAPTSTGTYAYAAVFDGNNLYSPLTAAAKVYVMPENGDGSIRTKVTALPAECLINQVFTASATLSSADIPVAGKVIEFSFYTTLSTVTALGVTDDNGLAVSTFTAPSVDVPCGFGAAFNGDLQFGASRDQAVVTVRRYPVNLLARDVVGTAGQPFAAIATLADGQTEARLDNKNLEFSFYNGVSTTTNFGLTDSSGTATVIFTAPSRGGTYTYLVRLNGDPLYADTTAQGKVLLTGGSGDDGDNGAETYLVANDAVAGLGDVFFATATLTAKGRPLADKPVTITFGSEVRVATTSAYGVVVATFTVPLSTGTYYYQAQFDRGSTYGLLNTTGALTAIELESLDDPSVVTLNYNSEHDVTLLWTKVTRQLLRIKGYSVERSPSLRSGWERVAFVYSSATALTCSFTEARSAECFYRVKTVLWNTQQSKGTVLVSLPPLSTDGSADPEVSTTTPTRIYAAEDFNAWVRIPESAMAEIQSAAASTMPVRVSVEKLNDNRFLLAYDLKIVDENNRVLQGIDLKNNKKGVKIEISYESLPQKTLSRTPEAVRQMAMYYFNGVEWMKVGGVNDIISRKCYLYSQKLGRYGIGFAKPAQEFSLTGVAPRIFTPEEASETVNRVRFYFENPEGGEVTIRIFDVTGAQVRRNVEREADTIMYWDGRDNSGTIVRGGIYIYQIETGRKVMTGTVVVAK